MIPVMGRSLEELVIFSMQSVSGFGVGGLLVFIS